MLPDVNQIWNWVVKRFVSLNGSNHQTVSKSNARPYTNIQYYKIQNEFGFTRLDNNNTPVSYPYGTYCTITDTDIRTCWNNICRNESLDSKLKNTQQIGTKNSSISTVTMWLLGDGSYDGLVFWEHATQQYHLRYIPVDFNLFDSIMAELNLRRRKSNTEDDTVAIYEPSDWIKEEATGTWRVQVKKDATTGFEISIENNDTPTPINLTGNETVKQFAEYDWSTRNANTLEGEIEPRFYVSWPEKMLLQEFLKGQFEGVEFSTPQIMWCLNATDSQIRHSESLIGIHFGLLDRDWTQVDIMEPNYQKIETICTTDLNEIYPFLILIRPNDMCIRTPKEYFSTGLFTDTINNAHKQLNGIMRSVTEWTPINGKTHDGQKISTTINEKEILIHFPNSTTRVMKNKNGTLTFTGGFNPSDNTIVYKDFIEQRAKVLDPTSRALLAYLKYNTPQSTTGTSDGGDESSPSADETQKNLLKKVKLSKNLILEGVPGTGKTFAFKNTIVKHWNTRVLNLEGGECQEEAITMHPSTSYEDFLEGLRPKVDKDDVSTESESPSISIRLQDNPKGTRWFFHPPKDVQGNFSVADGFFLNVCKQAVQNPSKDYLVLLDEINRCNIPSVFGDLLTAIERSKRAVWDDSNQCWDLSDAQTITLAISKRKLFVPENVYAVGTMNTTDRSVAPMDMALRRRFAFHRIEPEKPTKTFTRQDIVHGSINAMERLNEGISDPDNQTHGLRHWGADALLGYSYIYDLASDLERYHDKPSKHAQIVQHHWNHHILPQLADILFSNQITGDERKNLLKLIEVGVGEARYKAVELSESSHLSRPIVSLVKEES